MALLVSHNCSSVSTNLSANSSGDLFPPLPPLYNAFLLPLTVGSVLGNAVAIGFLARPRLRRHFGRLRLQLLHLSLAELVFNAALASLTLLELLRTLSVMSCGIRCRISLAVAILLSDALLSIRNWCIVGIALVRCDAVIRPLQRLRWRVTFRWLNIYLMVLTVFSFGIAFLRRLNKRLVVCGNYMAEEPFIEHHEAFHLLDHVFWFGFQRLGPALLLALSTATTLAGVWRRRRHLPGVASGEDQHRTCAVKTTRIVLALTSCFVTLEGFFFIFIVLNEVSEATQSTLAPNIDDMMAMVNRSCVAADSTCNLFIYVYSNRIVKAALGRRSNMLRDGRPPTTTSLK